MSSDSNFSLSLTSALRWWMTEIAEIFRSISLRNRSKSLQFEVSKTAGVNLLDREKHKNIRGTHNITLLFSDNSILYRKVKLPATAKKNINKVVDYEFNRYFPLNPENALISFSVIDSDMNKNSIEIEIWAISKDLVLRYLASIRETYAFDVRKISIADSDGNTVIQHDDSNTASDQNKRLSSAHSSHKATLLIVALLLALLIYPVFKMDQYLQSIESEIDQLQLEAKPSIEVRDSIQDYEKRLQFMIGRKKEHPDLAYIWSLVTQTIHGKAVLERMEINGRQVKIEGETPSVERIIKILEADEKISDVKVIGSVSSTAKNNNELMKLSMTIHD